MEDKKKLNVIFDECIEQMLTGEKTVEQCLLSHPEYAKELEPMLRTAELMQKAVDVKPSAEFRAKARYQMQLKMAECAPQTPARTRRFAPRWAVALGTAVMVFLLGGGAALASGTAMPGNPLYAVKLGVENIEVNLARSPETKIERYVSMADQRVNEIAWMAENGKTGDMPAAADRLNSYYASINTLSITSNQLAMSAVDTASQTGGRNQAGATTESALVPPTVSSTTVAAGTDKNAVTTIVTTTVVTVPPPAMTPAIVTTNIIAAITPATTTNAATFGNTGNASANNTSNASKIMNILVYNSIIQTDKLQQLIDSPDVPESVKPALRRALAASKAGYSNAISNFGQ